MDSLGLGVRLTLDDDMTRNINPIIRDIERLRRQAQATTRTFNDMRGAYDPFSNNRRQKVQDYYMSMQSLDRVLVHVADRLVMASKSANMLAKATNRAQFTGNFNMMYKELVRVQGMFSSMGYGMSKMQKDLSNNRAFMLMDNQMKDLKDRIKLTQQALKEMQASPNASKMVKEIDVAKRALAAYQNELKKSGQLQKKLAETHGLGYMKSAGGGRDILYEQSKSIKGFMGNVFKGLSMGDLAVSSKVAYSSLSKTADMLTGVGNTAIETKQKLTQMAGALTTLGTTLTTTVSLISALAIGGWGYLAGKDERANAQYTGQTITTREDAQPYKASMRESYASAPGLKRDEYARMYAHMTNVGESNIGNMETLSMGSSNISYAWGEQIKSLDILQSTMKVAKGVGVSYADALDLVSLGLKSTDGDLEKATESVLANSKSFMDAEGQWRRAFDTLEDGNSGSIQKLVNGIKGLSNTLVILWEHGLAKIVGGLGDFISKMSSATNAFLEAHPAVAKFLGGIMGLVLAIGLLAPPMLLVTGFLMKFRTVIGAVSLAVQALAFGGGVAALGTQASMLATRIHAATVALARFPQTLLFGVLPALYGVMRTIPLFLLNMARLNPAMTAITVGMIAYSKNWLGFGDTVDAVTSKIKSGWNNIQTLVNTGLEGGDLNLSTSDLEGVSGMLLRVVGTAKIAKDMISAIFSGETFTLTDGQANLAEQLGISGMLSSIATGAKAVKDFFTGFADGIQLVYDKMSTFLSWMVGTFEPVIVGIANAISKLFGGAGDATGISDIMESANGANETMMNLGKMAGVALTALLGFKLLKPLFSGLFNNLLKNPFTGLISGAKGATKAVSGMVSSLKTASTAVNAVNSRGGATGGGIISRATGGIMNTVRNATGANQRGRDEVAQRARASATGAVYLGNGRYGTSMRNRDGSAGTVLTRNSPPPMTAQQQARANQLTTNANARGRGHNIGASTVARNNSNLMGSGLVDRQGRLTSTNAALNGQQVHARQQGRLSRALFGQRYDVYDQQGRRTNVNSQGGLLRRQSNDSQVRERTPLTRRVGNAVGGAVSSAMSGAVRNTRQAAGMAGTAVVDAGRQVANSRAMKPIRVPVQYINSKIVKPVIKPIKSTIKWISGRLQTAGVIRQGNQAGQQAGNRFKRAFNAATRTMGRGAGMFTSVVSSAGSAGRRAGSTMLKGFGVVGKGIGKVVGAGLRAIPILGWAITAWSIISTIFTNWSAIQSAAQTAWNWIKENGVSTLQAAWELIKAKALEAWEWIKTSGVDMATQLGADILTFLSEAFTSVVSFAVEQFTGLIATAGGIAVSIGQAIWDGITGVLSGIGDFVGGLISSAIGAASSAVSAGKRFLSGLVPEKAHAKGGIINSPHIGLVGEAGSEAIIPLSGNQRDRARMLLNQTAGILGYTVTKNDKTKQAVSTVAATGMSPTNYSGNNSGGLKSLSNFKDNVSGSEPSDNVVQQVVGQVPSQSAKVETAPKATGSVKNNTVLNNFFENTQPKGTPKVANDSMQSSNASKSEDNSVTIANLHIQMPQGATVDERGGREAAKALMKELQKLMKQERLRTSGKNLTLEDMILKY